MKRQALVVGMGALSLLLLAACGSGNTRDDSAEEGELTGAITIGPLCPVEPCDDPSSSVYAGRELLLSGPGGSAIRAPLASDGTFFVSLPPDTYDVQLEACDFLGCAETFPTEVTIVAGETTTLNIDVDTGIRAPGQAPGGISQLVSDLVGAGAVVAQGESISQPFLSVPGEELILERERVQVFTYESPEAAQSDADKVSPTGSPIGATMVTWQAPPHFYLRGELLVLYVGNNGIVTGLLEEVLGPQFAGGEVAEAMPEVESYLALMDDLAEELRRLATSGEGSVDRVTAIASQLEGYIPFFAALDDDGRAEMLGAYGDQLELRAERVAGLATQTQDAVGGDAIARALERTPAFAITETTSGDVPPAEISALLLPEEVAALAGGVELAIEYRDGKAAAAAVDPAQVEHMDTFDVLTFTAGSRSLVLSVIDFDSEQAASDHLGLTAEGMQDLEPLVGDSAASLEVNQSGIGSMVVFKKGELVVSLHTAQPTGVDPLVGSEELEQVARLVGDRL